MQRLFEMTTYLSEFHADAPEFFLHFAEKFENLPRLLFNLKPLEADEDGIHIRHERVRGDWVDTQCRHSIPEIGIPDDFVIDALRGNIHEGERKCPILLGNVLLRDVFRVSLHVRRELPGCHCSLNVCLRTNERFIPGEWKLRIDGDDMTIMQFQDGVSTDAGREHML